MLRPSLLALSIVVAVARPLEQAPQLRILAPLAEDLVAGEVTIVAEMDPAETPVSQMVFSVDGAVACRVTAPPYRCAWKGPNELQARVVRVVATLAGGARVSRSLSTASPGFVDAAAVRSVLVGVNVRDRRGRPVPGLAREDFRLFDNGRPREIEHFGTESVPVDVLLALDVSGSMQKGFGDVRAAALAMIDTLRPQDRVTLAGFNTSLFLIAPPQATREQRVAALRRVSATGGTAVNDAILAGLKMLQAQEGRRALIIFTDGEDRASQTSDASLEQRLLADNVVLYAVGQGRAAEVRTFRTRVERLASATGGRAFFFKDLDDATGAFRDIVQELTTQYVLGFTPEPARPGESSRALKVEVTDEKHRVTARAFYVPPPPGR